MLQPRLLPLQAVDLVAIYTRTWSCRAAPKPLSQISQISSARFFSSSLINPSPSFACQPKSPPRILLLQSAILKSSPARSFSTTRPRRDDAKKPTPAFLYPESLVIYHSGATRTTLLGMLKFGVLMTTVFFVVIIAPALWRAGEPWWKPLGVIICAIIPMAFTLYSTNPQVAFLRLRLPRFARSSPDLLRRYAEAPPTNALVDVGVLNFHGRPRVVTVPLARLAPTHERFGLVNWVVADDAAAAKTAASTASAGNSNSSSWLRPRPLTKLSIRERANDARETWVWDAVVAAVERRKR